MLTAFTPPNPRGPATLGAALPTAHSTQLHLRARAIPEPGARPTIGVYPLARRGDARAEAAVGELHLLIRGLDRWRLARSGADQHASGRQRLSIAHRDHGSTHAPSLNVEAAELDRSSGQHADIRAGDDVELVVVSVARIFEH